MGIGNDEAPGAFADQAQAAADVLELSLLRAVGSVEAELRRVMRTGEDDLRRLAGMVAETLAKLAVDGVMGAALPGSEPSQAAGGGAGSLNQIAAAVARAARRGARFS